MSRSPRDGRNDRVVKIESVDGPTGKEKGISEDGKTLYVETTKDGKPVGTVHYDENGNPID